MPCTTALLEEGLGALELDSSTLAPRLEQYLRLLAQWNRVHNLTTITDPEEMVTKHLLDSLSVWRYLPEARILDVGTGAGLPGIPLALACPDRAFVLLDSRAKKLGFVRHAVRELGLANAQTVHARVEDYRPDNAFDGVIARAFAALPKLAELARPLLKPGGLLLAMAGRESTLPDTDLPPGFDRLQLIGLKVPMLEASRHLLILAKTP